MDNEPVLFEVKDRAVERANEYLPKVNRDDFENEEDYIDEEARNMADRFIYISAYHQAQRDIISLIESRISELLGDAQPTPILRYELRDLIKRIKEEGE